MMGNKVWGVVDFVVAGALAAVISTGCSPKPEENKEATRIAPDRLMDLDVNVHPANKVVCDPFDDGSNPRINGGLIARLFYLQPGQARFRKAGDYIMQGRKSSQKLFFSSINVPTRKFEAGFATETGDVVRDDAGQVLNEYFALEFLSVIKLAPDQEEGLYEFALLSDDGAVLKLRDEDGIYRPIVDNDGDHPTRLGCGTQLVNLQRDSEKPVEIQYYQGPRYHISAIVLMRKARTKADGAIDRDPACGVAGNDIWFDSNKLSEPRKAYTDLLARDWRVLGKDNYGLPNSAMFNPCVSGIAPKISGFRLAEASHSSLWLKWETDIPATSQVSYAESGSDSSLLTKGDNVLRTSHSVIVTGLKAYQLYRVQAVSISETYGRAMSAPDHARTEY